MGVVQLLENASGLEMGLGWPLHDRPIAHLAYRRFKEALTYLAQKKSLDYRTILKVYKILFGGFYPWAGKDRNKLVPHLAVFKGLFDDPRSTVFERPDLIMAVDYALKLAADKNE